MSISPLIQKLAFDVSDWEPDPQYFVFPQGARAKDAFIAPDSPSDSVLVPGKRYLFKHSRQCYPDQFWGEIIAYRVGCYMGLNVPPAFVAFNSRTDQSAALIEWFYEDGKEEFTHAGDLLQNIQPNFDREKGTSHNLMANSFMLRLYTMFRVLNEDWRQWWVDALLFDALIGNTDRHQDNWGLIFTAAPKGRVARMSPLFDNGTSLGHERFLRKTQCWSEKDYRQYIADGIHHVRWSLKEDGVNLRGHTALLIKAMEAWPDTRQIAYARLKFNLDELVGSLRQLMTYDVSVPLTEGRLNFIVRLLKYRYQALQLLLL